MLQQADDASAQLSSLKAARDSLAARNAELEGQVETLRSEIGNLTVTRSAELAAACELGEQYAKEKRDLQAELAQCRETIASLSAAAETRVDELQGDAEGTVEEAGDLNEPQSSDGAQLEQVQAKPELSVKFFLNFSLTLSVCVFVSVSICLCCVRASMRSLSYYELMSPDSLRKTI